MGFLAKYCRGCSGPLYPEREWGRGRRVGGVRRSTNDGHSVLDTGCGQNGEW